MKQLSPRTNFQDKGGQLYNVLAYGATGNGSTDDTAAIQSALDAAAAGGGGTVYLPNATYVVSNLTIDSYVTLQGAGKGALLQAKSGATGYMIALKTPASSQQTVLRDFTLKPNTGTLGGVKLDNTGFGTSIDPLHVIENVVILNAGGIGFYFDNSQRELQVRGCYVHYTGGVGFYIGAGCTDARFVGNTTGPTTGHGYQIIGNNNNFVACKAFYAGYNGSTWNTASHGFYLNGTNYSTMTSCSAQQNAKHGYSIEACSRVTIAGCEADTNSSGTTGGVGFNTSWTTYSCLSGNTGANNGILSPGNQAYGIQVDGTQTGLYLIGNSVTGSSGNFGYVSGTGYMLIDNTVVDLSGIPTKMNNITVFALAGSGSGTTTVQAQSAASGTLTLPAATDTLVGRATTDTLTNKRITKRVSSTTSTAILTPNIDSFDRYVLTAQAAVLTVANYTGTPNDEDMLIFRIKATGAFAISWGTNYIASGTVALPTTTVSGKTIRVGFIYDATAAKLVCTAADATGY